MMSTLDEELTESLRQAERGVHNSIQRFESAMDQLAERVEFTSQKIHFVKKLTRKTKEAIGYCKDQIQKSFLPIAPVAFQIGKASGRAIMNVRARPYLWIAAGVMGYAAYKVFQKRTSKTRSILVLADGKAPDVNVYCQS
jgi:hypothetical protein